MSLFLKINSCKETCLIKVPALPCRVYFEILTSYFFLQVFPDCSDEPVTLDEPSYQETTENADTEEDDDDDGCQSAFDDNGIQKFQLYFNNKYFFRPFSTMIIRIIDMYQILNTHDNI